MPETPDLAVVRSLLEVRLTGQEILSARLLKPLVLRSLAADDFPSDISGRRFEACQRRGKFLLLHISGDRLLVINPMLTGALQCCSPKERMLKRVCLILELSGGMHLRYLDDTQMGKVYYGRGDQLSSFTRLEEQGSDTLDEPLLLEEFARRLRPFRGDVKGMLTRGDFVSGIGNAYADEILWAAGLSPFRKRTELSSDQIARLHEAVYMVPRKAVAVLQDRMGEGDSCQGAGLPAGPRQGQPALPPLR